MYTRTLTPAKLISLGLSKGLNEAFKIAAANTHIEHHEQSIKNIVNYIKSLDISITHHRKQFIILDKKEILMDSYALTEAAKLNYTEIIELLIKEDVYDPEQIGNDYDDYPHCYAIEYGSVESLELLRKTALAKTPSINIFTLESTKKKTLLQLSLNEKPDYAEKQNQMINYLLEQKLNANEALVTAAVNRLDLDLVKIFIQYKTEYTKDIIKNLVTNINPENSDKTLQIITILLETYIASKEEFHDTLLYAIKRNYFTNFPKVIPLIENFTNKISKFELTIHLFDAIGNNKYIHKSNGILEVLTGLITAGADINYRDHNHRTPLYYAVKSLNHTAIQVICNANPSIETLNYSGKEDKDDIDPHSNLINLLLLNNGSTSSERLKKIESSITILVNGGVPIKNYAINYFKERENYPISCKILSFLYKAIQERTSREKLLKLTPYHHGVGSELTLFGKKNYPEEKLSLEDQCNQFLLKVVNIGDINSNYTSAILVRMSFLNQQADSAQLAKIKSQFLYVSTFIPLFSDMIDSIKLFNYSSHIITTFINLIHTLQDVCIQPHLLINHNYLSSYPSIALSYCLEYPEIAKALLRVCPFEQRRLLNSEDKAKLAKIEKITPFPKADLFDLLFYIEGRTDDGENQVKRKKALCEITELLRNKNYKEAHELINEKSKSLLSKTYAVINTISLFKMTENTVDILTGILNQYDTPEKLEPHACHFITYVEARKNKILSGVLAKPKLNDSISNLTSNSISNKKV